MSELKTWIENNRVAEVECLVPDINGVLRGKVLPAAKLLQAERNVSLRLPASVFNVTITGEYADVDDDEGAFHDPDMTLRPDASTLCLAPGFKTPTAYVFADAFNTSGEPWRVAPRHVLRSVVELYHARGWRPIVAPELEFYLTEINADPDLPLMPPTGRSGRAESSPQPYGLEAITEHEELIERIYEYAEAAELGLDTMIHESGTAQLEINFLHGEPIRLCDQVMVFKRIVRQVALQHRVYATFMAKPMEQQPGSAMHLHVSVIDESGRNLFADDDGADSEIFRHFIGGLQHYLPAMTPLLAPNVNSFRRLRPNFSAPTNVEWGYDNRTCGLRVPISGRHDRRVENRLPGADANPYLAIAATLMSGYLGIEERLERSAQMKGNAYHHPRTLPRTLEHALERFSECEPARRLLGAAFCDTFTCIKEAELEAFQGVISSWERDHLLLKV
jgi:glutamine synthetase